MADENIEALLPKHDDLIDMANFALDYWRVRNQYVQQMREALEGLNKIVLPVNTQYKPQAIHTYFLASILNEKIARFLDIPIVQVVNEDPLDPKSLERNSELEHALNTISYEMERLGDGDVWSRVVADAILLDEGVEKIQMAPTAFWPEISMYPEESGPREAYKRSAGIPFRTLYVPLEAQFPIYDGPIPTDNFEFEIRSLAACKRNKIFNQGALADYPRDPRGDHATKVTIMHYHDQQLCGDYVVVPGTNTASSVSPDSFKIDINAMTSITQVRFLYGYRHGLGRLPYNFVAGRYGGWKTQNNRIEAVNKGFLELSQRADELLSQVATNVRATLWPSLNYQIDPELRGEDPGSNGKQPPQVGEGEAIYTYKGEDLKPIIVAQNNPAALWLMDQYKEQLSKLGGSSVLMGQNQPGVDTGYHNAQQVSQAEHLDEKIEQHLSRGAITRYSIIMLYARYLKESIPVHYIENNGEGAKGHYVSLEPKHLSPLPRLDVSVRRPRSVDILANIRAAREATDDRGGRGALMADFTAREKFLAVEYPDIEEKRIILEDEKRKILAEGVITEKIKQAINIGLVKQGMPNLDPAQVANMDPALLDALNQVAQTQAPGAGGIDPNFLARNPQQTIQNPLDRSGGLPAGQAQPEANIGAAVASSAGVV